MLDLETLQKQNKQNKTITPFTRSLYAVARPRPSHPDYFPLVLPCFYCKLSLLPCRRLMSSNLFLAQSRFGCIQCDSLDRRGSKRIGQRAHLNILLQVHRNAVHADCRRGQVQESRRVACAHNRLDQRRRRARWLCGRTGGAFV